MDSARIGKMENQLSIIPTGQRSRTVTDSDQATADKFADSWNHVYDKSVYTHDQFIEWIQPWSLHEIRGCSVLELGCGSGALLIQMASAQPVKMVGVDLGDSVKAARELLKDTPAIVEQLDLKDHKKIQARHGKFDYVYCIGVLHHLMQPHSGFASMLELTKPGGRFHGWVYAYEGNGFVRWIVDPVRRFANHLPWWITKHLIALPLAVPFYLYSKFCRLVSRVAPCGWLLLYDYMQWISVRNFKFHHHVAFDQLVTPVTHYLKRAMIEQWLSDDRIDHTSIYIIFRNGNGWKFGGRLKEH